MNPNSSELDIMSIDLRLLTPEQRSALTERAFRRAHAERARAFAEMSAHAGLWLRRTAAALMSRAKITAEGEVRDHNRA